MSNDKNKLVDVKDALESPKTNAELQAQMDALDNESKALDLELKREAVAKLRQQRQEKLDRNRANMDSIKSMMEQRDRLKNQCTHRKGGRGAGAVLGGQGNAAEYAIIKHVLPSGRLMILCQRCGAEEYSRDPLTKEPATEGFARFSTFSTDNTASQSSLFLPSGYGA